MSDAFGLSAETLVVAVNMLLAGLAVVALAFVLARAWRRSLASPTRAGTAAEMVVGYFLGRARQVSGGRDELAMSAVAPLLASLFLVILAGNLIGFLPVPYANRPPTSYFGATVTLALCAVLGSLVVTALARGVVATLKHLFWPNPMQLVSEVTDVISLGLRLFGNIAGEYLTVTLVLAVVPWGIPLVLHVLGLIPAFVQPLIFVLLTSSFIATALTEGTARKE